MKQAQEAKEENANRQWWPIFLWQPIIFKNQNSIQMMQYKYT